MVPFGKNKATICEDTVRDRDQNTMAAGIFDHLFYKYVE